MRKLYLFFVIFLITCSQTHAEFRTWTDVQGRTVVAEYTGMAAGNVKLKMEKGTVVSFEYAKLSEEDQQWVRGAFVSSPEKVAAQIDKYIESGLRAARRKPNPETTDAQFVRRAYLEITGAIPGYEDTKAFLKSRDPDKRRKLIDQLLDSEEYVSHTFNWYADQLRVISRERDYVVYETYIAWIKDAIKNDMPWDEFVRRLMEAEGNIFEDPASGWFLRDYGKPLQNLSSTASLFLGKEIGCAQCHDHPFEDWTQRDFYSMAAFLGQRTERAGGTKEYREMFSSRKDEIAAVAGADKRIDLILAFNQQSLGDNPDRQLTLPEDYQYFDASPGDTVIPVALFGERIDVSAYKTPRKAFSAWMTSRENKRFSIAITNRIWNWTFGLPLHSPIDNISKVEQSQNPELLSFLAESLVNMNFSLKKLRRSIYYSKAWQREATMTGITEKEIGSNQYPFPGPALKRMSAEQLWDSCMTLIVTDPYDLRRDATDISQNFQMDIKTIPGADAAVKADRAEAIIKEVITGEAPSIAAMPANAEGKALRVNGDLLRDYGDYFIRASEMSQPAIPGHVLRVLGQSDRTVPDNASTAGSIPQILYLMNSYLSQFPASEDSMIYRKAGVEDENEDKLDHIYLSILNRLPTRKDTSICKKLMSEDTNEFYQDLIWALINSREFLFIQ